MARPSTSLPTTSLRTNGDDWERPPRVSPRRSICRAVAALGASGWLLGCSALEPPGDIAPPPDLTFRHARVQEFKAGVLTTRASMDELRYSRDTGHLEGQRTTFLPLTGGMAGGTLRAGLATGNSRSGIARLSDGAQWTAVTGDHAVTSACVVDLVDEIARGQEPVTLEGAGYRIDAAAFESHYGGHGPVGTDVHFHGGAHVQMEEGRLNSEPASAQDAGAASGGSPE